MRSVLARILAPIAAKFEKKPEPVPAAANDDALRAAAAAAAFDAHSK